MNDVATFLELVRDELGLAVDEDALDRPLDQLEAWDSVQLLRLIGVLEAEVGRPLSFPDVIRARSLRAIHAVVTG